MASLRTAAALSLVAVGAAALLWALFAPGGTAETPPAGPDLADSADSPPADDAAPEAERASAAAGEADALTAPLLHVSLGELHSAHAMLMAAGATPNPADTVTLTATCAGTLCDPGSTAWVVAGRPVDGNPVEVDLLEAGVHTASVHVRGRPAPERTLTLLAAPRAVDWPADGWATGRTDHDPSLAALVYADLAGWMPPCSADGAHGRRLCPQPLPEPTGDAPLADVDEVDEVEGEEDQAAPDDDGDAAAADAAPRDEGAPAATCAAGTTHTQVLGDRHTTPGLPPGCVSVRDTAHTLAMATGGSADTLCDDPCSPTDHTTVADLYRALAAAVQAPPAASSCTTYAPDLAPCPAGAADALAVGAPPEPLMGRAEQPATRSDLATLAVWAAGHTHLVTPAAPAHASGHAGTELTIDLELTIPRGWGRATLTWPDTDQAERSCPREQPVRSGTRTVTCTWTPAGPGTQTLHATLTGPGGQQTRVPFELASDPPEPAVEAHHAFDGGQPTVTATSDRPVDRWHATIDGVDIDHGRTHNTAGFAATISASDTRTLTMTFTGSPTGTLELTGCNVTGCATSTLELDPGTRSAPVDTDPTHLQVTTTGGTVDLPGDWTGTAIEGSNQLVAIYATTSTGELEVPATGTPTTGSHLRIIPGPFWDPEFAPANLTLNHPEHGHVNLCVTHPDAEASCPAS